MLASASKLGRNSKLEYVFAVEIDDDLKPHLQERNPGVIFRLEMLGFCGPLERIRELQERVSCAHPG
jgi:hypothetical protein